MSISAKITVRWAFSDDTVRIIEFFAEAALQLANREAI
jgi:HD-like signal output (HDOD) protein